LPQSLGDGGVVHRLAQIIAFARRAQRQFQSHVHLQALGEGPLGLGATHFEPEFQPVNDQFIHVFL
jgi:hypothetical protein